MRKTSTDYFILKIDLLLLEFSNSERILMYTATKGLIR